MKKSVVTVQNAEGEPETTAEILVQNKIDYVPKVSVIIPVYNVEKYLRECLDSVVGQTLREIEIICVDDGSTDSSLDILKEYAAKDKRISVLRQENLHAGVARNAGLTVAKGEYLSFLDSDDFFELNMLKEMYQKAKDNKADICVCGADRYDKGRFKNLNFNTFYKGIKEGCFFCDEPKITDRIFQCFQGVPWDKMILHTLLNKLRIRFSSIHHHNDTALIYSSLAGAKNIVYNDKNLVHWRFRENSICHIKGIDNNCFAISLRDLYNNLHKINCYNKVKRSFINYIISLSVHVYNGASSTDKKAIEKLMCQIYDEYNLSNYPISYFYALDKLKIFQSVIKRKTVIPIILSADNNYALFIYTTMLSILRSSKIETMYDFYIMVPQEFSIDKINLINTLKQKYDCKINFIKMKEKFSDVKMQISHITIPTYYRLLAGDLLPKEYDKCIYLDVDVCVCHDLTKLFNINLEDKYVAGVRAPGYYYEEQKNCKRLCLPNMRQYINAGVLVMNLKKIRQDNMTEVFLSLANKNYSSQDQDVINVACFGDIQILSPKYNVLVKRLTENSEKLFEVYPQEDISEALNNPVIIHYADKIKPWNDTSVGMGFYWWKNIEKDEISNYFKISFLNIWYYKKFCYPLNIDNPQTFNEKIQWLKLYDATPIKTRLADKYLVRDWVKEKIGEKYLIPLLGVYDKFEEIDFDKLPEKFVIKCNHGCAYNIIVKDKSKLDLTEVKAKLDKWMNDNFAYHSMEMHYRDIEPKIIIEKYIENEGTEDLYDYKFWCFAGKVYYIQFLSERNLSGLKMAFYDRNWQKQNFVYSYPLDKKNMSKPDNLQQMIDLAEKLSAEFNHVRVDFYRLNNGKILFGEMTFTTASGTCKWNDEKINRYFGDLIKLPELAYNIDTGEYYKLPENLYLLTNNYINQTKSITKYKLFGFVPLVKIETV